MLDKDDYQYLYIFQRPCIAPTYECDAAMITNMGGMGPFELDIGRLVYRMSNKFDRNRIS